MSQRKNIILVRIPTKEIAQHWQPRTPIIFGGGRPGERRHRDWPVRTLTVPAPSLTRLKRTRPDTHAPDRAADRVPKGSIGELECPYKDQRDWRAGARPRSCKYYTGRSYTRP